MEREIIFYSAGIRLAGVLFTPDDPKEGRTRPGIVLCHGYTGIKEVVLVDYARKFVGAGYVCLTFDYRGFGESEGPRWRLIPLEQVEDIRNAITFLQAQKEVSQERIGLWGTSFGGANVPYAAGVDSRVKCAVAQVGFGDGERVMRQHFTYWEMKSLLKEIEEDRTQRVLSGKSKSTNPLDMLVNDPDSRRFLGQVYEAAPKMKCELPLETTECLLSYKPESVVDRISPRAILFLAAGGDIVCPPEEYEIMFQKAGEPKKLVILPDLPHYEIYSGEGFEKSLQVALEWFEQHL